MHLVIFHYHLLPGGVTQVIVSSVTAMLKFIPSVTAVTLVSGRRENTEAVLAAIRKSTAGSLGAKKGLHLEVIPEIGYVSEKTDPPSPQDLVRILTGKFKKGIWWIHNFQLGKNPVFTEALLAVAQEYPSIKMVLQIHDFPECARYEYVRKLQRHIKGSYYPVSPNVRYAVINKRDRKLLAEAGVPEPALFLLNNPLKETAPLANTIPDKALDHFFTDTEPSYEPEHPIWMYPVRTIRRKNVLEAGLITRMLPEEPNLFVTLPGVSEAEKSYSALVEAAFSRGLIKGVFASGLKGAASGMNFMRQISASTVILSTSIQEGFGYLFFNALQWEKPLFARYLDILDGTESIFRNQAAAFYSNILVPFPKNDVQSLQNQYLHKIEKLSPLLPGIARSYLKRELALLFSSEGIDFSFLSTAMQFSFLDKLEDPSLLRDTAAMNKTFFTSLDALFSTPVQAAGAADLEVFSLQAYAETVRALLASFNQDTIKSTDGNISERLLSIFAKLEHMRLLYD